MDFTGIVFPYPVNRPLVDFERQAHLDHKTHLEVEPFYQLSVINFNSIYMEQIDKYYSWKGALSGFFLLPILIFLPPFIWAFFYFARDIANHSGLISTTASWLFETSLSSAIIYLAFKIGIHKESFRWTHYPIRLNRKNRMVYVFRLDGTVLCVPWDDLYFTLGIAAGSRLTTNRVLAAHVLDKDRKTVLETFQFSLVSDKVEDLHQLWEFIRRYMEEGPEQLYQQVEFCMPVEEKRESYLFGLKRLIVNFNGQPLFQILFMPFFLLFSVGRFIAMHTSRIPKWPKEVEDACRIDPDDPYVRNWKTNPPGYR